MVKLRGLKLVAYVRCELLLALGKVMILWEVRGMAS